MPLSHRHATIVGAGVGGLAAAVALAQAGARVTVLEQAPALGEAGGGLQISPNGVAVLEGLGLGEALAAIGVPAAAVVLRDDRSGRQVLRLDLARASGRPYLFVHRADLVGLLADAARDAGAEIRLGRRVDVPSPETAADAGTVADCDILLGADGLRSRLRAAVDGPSRPVFTGQVAWRAVVPAGEAPQPEAVVHMGPGRHLVCYPLRGGAWVNLVAVEERARWTAEGWHHADAPDNLRAAFADAAPEVRALLARVGEVHVWGLFRHPVAQRWHRGRAAILGDAAHPALPFLAQGANMALEDAWVLAVCLARAAAPEPGLAAYQRGREARTRRIVAAAARNARNYHLRAPPLRVAAHTALRLGGALAPGLALSRFAWLYGYDAPQTYPRAWGSRPAAAR